MKISINILKEHPLNQEIYGDDEKQLNELTERIKVSGWIKPILVSKDYLIISGHQRVRAAKVLGYTEIDYEFMVGGEDKQLELLLNENAFREKTTLQKTKEGEHYHEIESRKAHERQIAGVELGVSETQGRTNEIVAGKIGMSESSYKKSRKVIQKIEETEDPDLKWFLGESLNENITLTANLVDKPIEFVTEIIERLDGDIKDISKVFHKMEQEELTKSVHLPSGKYQIVYVESVNQPINQFSQIPIGDNGEDNSVLFFWTTPVNLETSLKLINRVKQSSDDMVKKITPQVKDSIRTIRKCLKDEGGSTASEFKKDFKADCDYVESQVTNLQSSVSALRDRCIECYLLFNPYYTSEEVMQDYNPEDDPDEYEDYDEYEEYEQVQTLEEIYEEMQLNFYDCGEPDPNGMEQDYIEPEPNPDDIDNDNEDFYYYDNDDNYYDWYRLYYFGWGYPDQQIRRRYEYNEDRYLQQIDKLNALSPFASDAEIQRHCYLTDANFNEVKEWISADEKINDFRYNTLRNILND